MSTLVLCYVTTRQAQHIGQAARLAGGWVATHEVCRLVVADEIGPFGEEILLALIPNDWREAGTRTGIAAARRIAGALEHKASALRASLPESAEIATDFAVRIRERIAEARAQE